MTENSVKTEYILYLVANSRYGCSENDAQEFKEALDNYTEIPASLALTGEHYRLDYINGMFPELKDALQYYTGLIYPEGKEKKVHPDEVQISLAHKTMQRYNLKPSYDLFATPNAEQMERINKAFFPKIKKDLKEYPEVFKKITAAFGITSHDSIAAFHLVGTFDTAVAVASKEIEKERALKFTDLPGVPLGLEILELRERGILDDELKIKDAEAFASSKLITQFKFRDKTYDLGPAIRKQGEISPVLMQSKNPHNL